MIAIPPKAARLAAVLGAVTLLAAAAPAQARSGARRSRTIKRLFKRSAVRGRARLRSLRPHRTIGRGARALGRRIANSYRSVARRMRPRWRTPAWLARTARRFKRRDRHVVPPPPPKQYRRRQLGFIRRFLARKASEIKANWYVGRTRGLRNKTFRRLWWGNRTLRKAYRRALRARGYFGPRQFYYEGNSMFANGFEVRAVERHNNTVYGEYMSARSDAVRNELGRLLDKHPDSVTETHISDAIGKHERAGRIKQARYLKRLGEIDRQFQGATDKDQVRRLREVLRY